MSHGRKKQNGAYKLVNSLHGWVGLGPHRVEDGTTTFLSDSFNTNSINTERSEGKKPHASPEKKPCDLSGPAEPWGRRCFGRATDLHGDQPLVVGLVTACGVGPEK